MNDRNGLALVFIGLLIGAGMLMTGGCTVGPDYERPELGLPSSWRYAPPKGGITESTELAHWWTFFQDEQLNRLVEAARKNNLDLQSALYGIEESRALRDYTAGADAPRIDLTGSYRRTKESVNGLSMGFASDPMNLYSAGFDAGWEVDLFGRLHRSVEASQADLQASIMNYHSVLVTLYAEVARNYAELRTYQRRIKVAEQNVRIQQETLALAENRFKSGLVPELDVVQARQNLYATEAALPTLELARTQILNRLAVLTGQFPEGFEQDLNAAAAIPQPPNQFAVVLAADLLRQRPDVQQVERQLAAQVARIGVAEADLYPSLTLTGSFGYDATTFSKLGYNDSRAYSFGPGFRWNLLDGDRLGNLVRVEQARTEQLRLAYENAVLRAFEEVENAFASIQRQTERVNKLFESAAAARRAVELVQVQYKSGLVDFQNVLDTQRTLFLQEDDLAVGRGQAVVHWIALYKALGGGWKIDSIESPADASAEDTN